MNISYDRLARHLERCDELFADAELPQLLKSLYTQRLVGPRNNFRVASEALVRAESEAAKERGEARRALADITQPYRFVRTLVASHAPDLVIPEALSSLATDTDKKLAIEALLARIDASAHEPWAAELLTSEFAQRAPQVIRELEEDVAANVALSGAIAERASAYGPASEAFVAFRAAVRAGCGPTSAQYKRIAPPRRPEGETPQPATPA